MLKVCISHCFPQPRYRAPTSLDPLLNVLGIPHVSEQVVPGPPAFSPEQPGPARQLSACLAAALPQLQRHLLMQLRPQDYQVWCLKGWNRLRFKNFSLSNEMYKPKLYRPCGACSCTMMLSALTHAITDYCLVHQTALNHFHRGCYLVLTKPFLHTAAAAGT